MSLLDPIVARQIEKQEQRLGASMEYVKHIAHVAPSAFLKFMRFMPLAAHRKRLPVEAFAVAKIIATQSEDCGTCVQIAVNMARQDNVSVEIIRATVQNRPQDLPVTLQDIYHFAQATAQTSSSESTPDEVNQLRERLRGQWGEEALVEIALAIASAKVFPTTKRVLGYAQSCSLVQIEMK
jgi:alkylhydroperoxidase family enzyme